MKTVSKRILCLIAAACFIFAALPGHFSGVAADESEPALSARCETLLDEEGKDGSFGEAITDLRTSTAIKFDAAKNLSGADVFELNIYIEDINAVKSFVTETQYLQFGFSSRSNRPTSNHAEVDVTPQLEKNGWNAVLVKRSDFTEANINWNSVWYVFIRFADESAALPAALKNKEVKIRNICESFDLPAAGNDGTVLYDSFVIAKLGETPDSPLSDIGKTFRTEITSADLTDATLLKADLLISDRIGFESFLAGKKLGFVLFSDKGAASYDFNGSYVANAVSGWYTVHLPLSGFAGDEGFDLSAVTGFGVEIKSDAEKIGSAYALSFGFTNIRFVTILSPEGDLTYGAVKEKYDLADTMVTFEKSYTDFSYHSSADYRPLSDAENIEFDLYIDRYDDFENSFVYDSDNAPINASLNLKLSGAAGTLTWQGIEKKVIASGWNHLILPVSDAVNQNFDANAPFSDIAFTITGAEDPHKNPNYGNIMILHGFVSTKGEAPAGALQFEESALLSEGKAALMGNTYEVSQITGAVTPAQNISNAKYIEFDLYIQNYGAFKSLSAANNITGVRMMLSSSAGNSVSAIFSGRVTKSGWNHIAIPLSMLLNGEKNGTFDSTAVSSWKVLYVGDNTAATGLLKGQRIAVKQITAAVVTDPKLPEDAVVVLDQEGVSGTYGDTYSALKDASSIHLQAAADLSKTGQIEFDFYVENIENFRSLLSASIKPLCFALSSAADQVGLFTFTEQVTGEGWNHITVHTLRCQKSGEGSAVDLSAVTDAFLTFDSQEGNHPYNTEPFKIKNIVGSYGEYDRLPNLPDNIAGIVSEEGFSAVYGENIPLTFAPNGGYEVRKNLDTVVDLSKADFIEFDIYVTNPETLKAYKDLYLSLFPKENPNNGYRADMDFAAQVSAVGWNHIQVKKTAARSRGAVGSYPYNIDWKNVSAVALLTINSGAPAVTGTEFAVIANICGTVGEVSMIPALPQNVVEKINEGTENTLGAYFGYTQDRLFKEKIGPYDFSRCNTIEMDIYVEDYDLLKQSFECARGVQFSIAISSCPEILFGQYAKPRFYYAVQADLQDKITKSGWNHIKLGKADFKTLAHTMDWSNVTSFMIRYPKSKLNTNEEEKNPAGNVFIKVVNIVNTGILSDVPYDKQQPVKPDKKAIYINDAENLVDDNGSWNPTEVYVDENYKSENSHSVLRSISYLTDPLFAHMFYMFDYSADMSDIGKLKFDLFVDLPQFIQKEGNTLAVGLSSDRNYAKGSYRWKINIASLKPGWNSLEFDISSAQKQGTVSLDAVKSIFLTFESLNLNPEEYESILIGMDNLRYISADGNTVLKINDPDYDTDFDSGEYEDSDWDYGFDDTETTETVTQETAQAAKPEPKTVYQKVTLYKTTLNYLGAILVLCGEFALLAAGSVVAFVILKKKNIL